MMKAYPEYKDSGVEWLNGIPSHWINTTFKYCLEKIIDNRGRTPPVGDSGIPLVEAQQISKGGRYTTKSYTKYIDAKSYEDFIRDDVSPKDILMVTVGSIGQVCLVSDDCDFVIAQNIVGLRPAKKIINEYLYYYLISDLANFARQYVNKESVLNSVKVSNFIQHKLSIPPESEQVEIVHFLDVHTSRIDNLIAEKENFIKLLQEKRQTLISHVVVKGLDDNVKMKPSGVDWIGNIPEHWELKRYKHLFNIKKRIAGSLGYDVLSITQKGIKVKDIESGQGQLASDYTKYQLVYVGDFAMNHMDLLTGFVDCSKYNGVTSPDYRVFSLENKQHSKEYFLYLLQLGYLGRLYYPFGQGVANLGRWRFSTESFNEFFAPVPPSAEQVKIGVYLDKELGKIQNIITETLNSIELLKEHRTALISAAVTGKIDVREEA